MGTANGATSYTTTAGPELLFTFQELGRSAVTYKLSNAAESTAETTEDVKVIHGFFLNGLLALPAQLGEHSTLTASGSFSSLCEFKWESGEELMVTTQSPQLEYTFSTGGVHKVCLTVSTPVRSQTLCTNTEVRIPISGKFS